MAEKVVENDNEWMNQSLEKEVPKRTNMDVKRKKRLQNSIKVLVPLSGGLVFVTLWELQVFHMIFQLKTYQLPIPSVILQAIQKNGSTLLTFTGVTFMGAFFGLLLGSALGFLFALMATTWPKWGKGGLLLVVALNAVPIVALAPIANLWFGSGVGSRVAIVTITTMAAMAINMHKGMTNINPLALDLMHSYAAKKSEVFCYVRIWNSLPYMFTALKINATASMIAAIVGEFFYASQGLGYLLSNSIKVAQMPLGWACIVIASAVGITFYLLIQGIEKLCLGWHASERT